VLREIGPCAAVLSDPKAQSANISIPNLTRKTGVVVVFILESQFDKVSMLLWGQQPELLSNEGAVQLTKVLVGELVTGFVLFGLLHFLLSLCCQYLAQTLCISEHECK